MALLPTVRPRHAHRAEVVSWQEDVAVGGLDVDGAVRELARLERDSPCWHRQARWGGGCRRQQGRSAAAGRPRDVARRVREGKQRWV